MTNQESTITYRYFISYSGIKLPLNLVNEIDESGLHTRNTYYRAHYNDKGQLIRCEKIVYGETESEHVYRYYANGQLKQAQISEDDEIREIDYSQEMSASLS